MPPPMKPCTARQKIIWFMVEVRPHIRLATVKPAAAPANMMRVPSARERKPDSGMATTSAIKYDVCTQVISSLEAARPAWISESEADTTWMSRKAMNMPKHIARKAMTRAGSTRSLLAGVIAAPAVGAIVAALAIARS